LRSSHQCFQKRKTGEPSRAGYAKRAIIRERDARPTFGVYSGAGRQNRKHVGEMVVHFWLLPRNKREGGTALSDRSRKRTAENTNTVHYQHTALRPVNQKTSNRDAIRSHYSRGILCPPTTGKGGETHCMGEKKIPETRRSVSTGQENSYHPTGSLKQAWVLSMDRIPFLGRGIP